MCACTHSCTASSKASPARTLFQKQVRGIPLAASALFHAGFHELTLCRGCVAAQEEQHVAYGTSLLFYFRSISSFVDLFHALLCWQRDQGHEGLNPYP